MSRVLMVSPFLISLMISSSARAQQEPVPWTPATAPWTTQDVIDARIDEYAQYALMRMFAGDWQERQTASDILSAVKSGLLAGIYVVDQKVAALRAQEIGKSWWTVLPSGIDAICIQEPEAKPPLIAFSKEARKNKERLDAALTNAWHTCALASFPFRGYRQTLPPKQPRDRACEEVEGEAAIQVRVTECGGPVAGAGVDVYSNGALILSTQTGENGTARVDALDGFYSVWINNSQYRAFEVHGSCQYTALFDLRCGEALPVPETLTRDLRATELLAECVRTLINAQSQCVTAFRECMDIRCDLPEPAKGGCVLGCAYLRASCERDAENDWNRCSAKAK